MRMPESRPAPRISAKDLFKRIPGVIAAARYLRALWRWVRINLISRALVWGSATRERRLLVFEALTERLVLAQHPQESYVVNTSDRVIGRSLYARGEFDFQKFETAAILLHAHSDDPDPEWVLIDAGANIGSICIPAVRRGMVARAIAFELDPGNARLLQINTLLNGVEDQIDIRNMAVGAAPGHVTVQHSVMNFGDHRVGALAREEGIGVPMVVLDSLVGDLDLSQCILWMDIQGYEAFALQGAQELIAAGVPLIVEFSPEELDSFGSFDTFMSLVCASSYAVFYDLSTTPAEATPLNRTALEALSDRLIKQGIFTDLLFLPARSA